jgi:ribose 5-phosphate isomerase RpiB
MNILALGSTLVDASEAIAIADIWLSTPTQEARYLRRLLKVRRLEETF